MGCCGSKGQLTKENLDYLLKHTHYDEDTIRQWHSKFMKECPDGLLTPEKLIVMYTGLFPGEDAQGFCNLVFRSFDTDQNGTIDFKEFLLAIHLTSAGSAEEKLRRAFRMYDVDGNGELDLKEITKVIQAFYDMLGFSKKENTNVIKLKRSAEARAEYILRKMDTDKNGVLSEDEFLRGCIEDEELSEVLLMDATVNKTIFSLL